MRLPLGLLSAIVATVAPISLLAELPDARVAYQSGDLTFTLPASWRAQVAPAATNSGVVFAAEGGAAGRFTVAKLPKGSASKLDDKLDPMVAEETADLRISLEEAGYSPIAGSISVSKEGEAVVEAVSFRCRPAQGAEQLILTTTWRTGSQAFRARLQSPVAESGSIVDPLQASLKFRGQPTLGLVSLQKPGDSQAATWVKAKGAPAGANVAATTPLPSTTVAPPEKVAAAGDLGRILQDYRGSLVFIEGGGGAGSGFVCRMKDGTFLLTNQHVMAGMNVPNFTRLDRSPIAAGAGTAAVAHDLMRFGLQTEANPLVAMYDIEKEVRVGDEIVVLGNSEGARVIQPLSGKLIGIGPDRIEVTAEFVPGNSGSPIVHVPTGKVIGIATYLIQRRFTELTDSKEAKVRRFGFRLDSVKQWQPLNWQAFQQDKATMDHVEATTRDLMRLIKEMQADKWPNAADYTASSLSRAVRDLNGLAGRQGLSTADRSRAFAGFFSSVRAATQADVTQARQSLRYDFFQRSLNDESQVREDMYRLFDRLVKAR